MSGLDPTKTPLSRRRLLKLGLASAGTMSFASVLAACGAGGAPPKATEAPKATEVPTAAAARLAEPSVPQIPKQVVRFGNTAYLDGTQAIIGVEKGFFSEVGIELDPAPAGRVITTAAEMPALLVAGTIDVGVQGMAMLLSSLKQFPSLREFVISDRFQGWAIMAQPDGGWKSYRDFRNEGLSPEDAVKKTLAQLKGKRWTHANLPGSILAVNVILKLGGLTSKDVDLIPVAEPETVALMLRKQADFQLGGAPSRMKLQGAGFKPILEVIDLVKHAKPSTESPELALAWYTGWVTTTDFWQKRHDTVLRMASVMFRISKFIKEQQKEALNIHVPFTNKVAGTSITPEDGKFIYEVLDPFLTFEDQQPILQDPKSPLYYKWPLEARIKLLVDQGVFKPGEITADSATIEPEVYKELLDLKAKTDQALPQAKTAIDEAKNAGRDASKAEEFLKKAGSLYSNYQFLDALRFATAAKEWAEYSKTA